MFSKTKEEIKEILKVLNSNSKDFSSIFISPAGYTLIKTFFEKNKIPIKLDEIIFDVNVIGFLCKLGFFDGTNYCISSIKQTKILPLRTINSYDGKDIENTTNEFYGLLNDFLGNKNKQLIKNISSIIGELLNNISNHSGTSDIGDNTGEVLISANYQSGQYYKKGKNFIQISIVDSGIGILKSVRKKIPTIQTADEAIKKALEPKFTGGTTLDPSHRNFSGTFNRGIGLTTTKEIIKELGGDLFIGNKDYLYCYNGRNNTEEFEKINTWIGTFVVFNIYTNTKSSVDFEKLKQELLGQKTNNSQNIDNFIDFG